MRFLHEAIAEPLEAFGHCVPARGGGLELAHGPQLVERVAAPQGLPRGVSIGQQLELCAQVRVGVDWRDIHQASYRAISEFLREADVISASADEAVDTALTSVFYPHGIGHLLGLQVHDVGGRQRDASGGEIERPYNHPFLRLTRKLEDGCVVTVEPGFYFIDQLLDEARAKPIGKRINWTRVEQLKPFGGIRIEDDVVARAGAPENLTRMGFASA